MQPLNSYCTSKKQRNQWWNHRTDRKRKDSLHSWTDARFLVPFWVIQAHRRSSVYLPTWHAELLFKNIICYLLIFCAPFSAHWAFKSVMSQLPGRLALADAACLISWGSTIRASGTSSLEDFLSSYTALLCSQVLAALQTWIGRFCPVSGSWSHISMMFNQAV